MRRILAAMLVGGVLYVLATYFTESRTAFIVVFGIGFAIFVCADLAFIRHLILLPWRRSRR
jgi:hypothetical protein